MVRLLTTCVCVCKGQSSVCILMAVTSCTVVAQFVVSIAQCNESRDRYWTIVVHSYNDIMGINHSC